MAACRLASLNSRRDLFTLAYFTLSSRSARDEGAGVLDSTKNQSPIESV